MRASRPPPRLALRLRSLARFRSSTASPAVGSAPLKIKTHVDKTPLEDVSSSVRVRLSELGYARPLLAPGALQRGDAARARQFGVDAADPRARAAFVTAEDLSACGFVLAQLLLGALGDETGNTLDDVATAAINAAIVARRLNNAKLDPVRLHRLGAEERALDDAPVQCLAGKDGFRLPGSPY